MNFVAIDFETADHGPDSACAVGLVRAREGRIVESRHYLMRPPRREFVFSHLHGIAWKDVAKKPSFARLWPEIARFIAGADFLAAHNAAFDRGVLSVCCASAGAPAPALPFLCTVRLSRRLWSLRPARLPDVCRFLGIKLAHHQALSDASACAQIVLAALQEGAIVEESCLQPPSWPFPARPWGR